LLSELRSAGATDYFALALNRTYRRFPAVTWATDRPDGFTEAEIAALEEINHDDYFDAIVAPVEARKGETLKFMGDGALAIFPAADDADFSEASIQALEAAREGLERLGMVNKARRETNRTEVRIGIGLHPGEVIFGNVGAADRLEFTVIGPAVNLTSWIEGLTKQLRRPILVSRAFARACARPLVSLGFHPVRGLFEPEEVFGVPE
jgi:adenylate cyclase